MTTSNKWMCAAIANSFLCFALPSTAPLPAFIALGLVGFICGFMWSFTRES